MLQHREEGNICLVRRADTIITTKELLQIPVILQILVTLYRNRAMKMSHLQCLYTVAKSKRRRKKTAIQQTFSLPSTLQNNIPLNQVALTSNISRNSQNKVLGQGEKRSLRKVDSRLLGRLRNILVRLHLHLFANIQKRLSRNQNIPWIQTQHVKTLI